MAKKKIIIISMKAGFGHLKAGQALFDYAEKFLPDIKALHVDISSIDHSFKKYAKIYDVISKHFPFVWGLAYAIFNVPFFASILRKLHVANYFLADDLRQYLIQEKPDVLLFTNMAPLPLFSFAFRREFPHILMAIVVTDYHGHAHYYSPFIDYYFAASDWVREDLLRAKVAPEKIIVSGIPVSPDFLAPQDKQMLRQAYGIQNDLPVVLLIASFRMQAKKLLQLIEKLLSQSPPFQLIILTNHNQERYTSIEKKFHNHNRLMLVNWTDKMAEYMTLADLIITKSGGLTVSECLALNKPMIIINPILGQEEYNARFVEKIGMGRWIKNIEEVPRVIRAMWDHPPSPSQPAFTKNASQKIFETLIP